MKNKFLKSVFQGLVDAIPIAIMLKSAQYFMNSPFEWASIGWFILFFVAFIITYVLVDSQCNTIDKQIIQRISNEILDYASTGNDEFKIKVPSNFLFKLNRDWKLLASIVINTDDNKYRISKIDNSNLREAEITFTKISDNEL